MTAANSFQSVINKLQSYWSKFGCAIITPYDLEMGAGTFHPATVLYCLGKKPWRCAFVQPSRRPADSRFGVHPNRLHKHHQFQVILKPAPENIQELYLNSLKEVGLDPQKHDIRFVEDDWESPTLGASGLGWEVWCDGMEVTQFTYMQKIGGIECEVIAGELAYGLERILMYVQNKENVYDLDYNEYTTPNLRISYKDIFQRAEAEFSEYALEKADVQTLQSQFNQLEKECKKILACKLALPAYDLCMKSSHIFNLLDARGVISTTERATYIARVRDMAKGCCKVWLKNSK
ncbi:MAG: glycine--tRNA ligase subunit alpha [Pseudomonadota bacterium]